MMRRTSLSPVARLHLLASELEAGRVPPPEIAGPVVAGLRGYLIGGADSLDAALGLRAKPSHRAPRSVETLAGRDEILRRYASRLLSDLTPTAQARALHFAIAEYQAIHWPHDQHAMTCPEHHVGTLRHCAWWLLKFGGGPLSQRHLRRVLATS